MTHGKYRAERLAPNRASSPFFESLFANVCTTPASGLWLAHMAGWPLNSRWIVASIALYLFAGACWLPVVWLQLQLAEIAASVQAVGVRDLPDRYWRYAKTWERLGYPAFLAMACVYFLMVLKPA